jgi:hypothetical protein
VFVFVVRVNLCVVTPLCGIREAKKGFANGHALSVLVLWLVRGLLALGGSEVGVAGAFGLNWGHRQLGFTRKQTGVAMAE